MPGLENLACIALTEDADSLRPQADKELLERLRALPRAPIPTDTKRVQNELGNPRGSNLGHDCILLARATFFTKLAKAIAAAVAAFLAGCAITINTAKEGETASQSATPTISPTVSIELPRSE